MYLLNLSLNGCHNKEKDPCLTQGHHNESQTFRPRFELGLLRSFLKTINVWLPTSELVEVTVIRFVFLFFFFYNCTYEISNCFRIEIEIYVAYKRID